MDEQVSGVISRRRDCQFAASSSPVSRRFNVDGEGVSAKLTSLGDGQARCRLTTASKKPSTSAQTRAAATARRWWRWRPARDGDLRRRDERHAAVADRGRRAAVRGALPDGGRRRRGAAGHSNRR